MENASKALIIAGAVLITIMVLGLAIYFFTQYSEFPEQQEALIKQAQITKFNREYESYDKDKMYGTDVATVMNKVISHNNSYADRISGQLEIDDDNYYIDVQITFLDVPESYVEQYYTDASGMQQGPKKYEDIKIKGWINSNSKNILNKTLGPIASMGKNQKTINLLSKFTYYYEQNNELEDFFTDEKSIKFKLTSGGSPNNATYDEFNYSLYYSGFTDFKRKLFECTGIEYNPETARVSKIIFEEISKT